jgi:opacity protein-like surface antigen
MRRTVLAACLLFVALPGAAEDQTELPIFYDDWYIAGTIGIVDVDPSRMSDENHFSPGLRLGRHVALNEYVAVGVNGYVDWIAASEHSFNDPALGGADLGGWSYGVDGQFGVTGARLMAYGKLGVGAFDGTNEADESDVTWRLGAGIQLRFEDYSVYGEWNWFEAKTVESRDADYAAFSLGVAYHF